MTRFDRFYCRFPLFTLFAGISLAFGLLVPTIFELGENPASRSSHPKFERAALIVFITTMVLSTLIWWIRSPSKSLTNGELNANESPQRKFQFGVRSLLIGTTLFALLMTVMQQLEFLVASYVVVAFIAAVVVYSSFYSGRVRLRAATLIVSLYFPFTWVVLFNKPFGHVSGLLQTIPIGPGIFPAIMIRGHVDHATWLAATMVIVALLIGAWLARRGGKLSLAYFVFILMNSCINSFFWHFAYRA